MTFDRVRASLQDRCAQCPISEGDKLCGECPDADLGAALDEIERLEQQAIRWEAMYEGMMAERDGYWEERDKLTVERDQLAAEGRVLREAIESVEFHGDIQRFSDGKPLGCMVTAKSLNRLGEAIHSAPLTAAEAERVRMLEAVAEAAVTYVDSDFGGEEELGAALAAWREALEGRD